MVIFVFVAVGLKTGIDGLFTIGVQQGYMPTQPIAYSHELHAGPVSYTHLRAHET